MNYSNYQKVWRCEKNTVFRKEILAGSKRAPPTATYPSVPPRGPPIFFVIVVVELYGCKTVLITIKRVFTSMSQAPLLVVKGGPAQIGHAATAGTKVISMSLIISTYSKCLDSMCV